MSINLTRQYRPPSTMETGTNDPLTSRFPRDMADNINNYFRYAGAHKVLAQLCVPEWLSHDSTTNERVIWQSAARRVPDGPTTLSVIVRHYRRAGVDETVWKLYCQQFPYVNSADAFDTTKLLGSYSSTTWTSDTGDLARTVPTALTIHRGWGEMSYFTLTATNGDASTRSALVSLDAWPNNYVTQAVFLP